MASPMSPGQSLLTALAGLTAYDDPERRMSPQDIAALPGDGAAEAFLGAVAVASRLAEEVRRLGGDPGALLGRVYGKATELAYS